MSNLNIGLLSVAQTFIFIFSKFNMGSICNRLSETNASAYRVQTFMRRRSLKSIFDKISLRNSRGGGGILSHLSKGGPTKLNISNTIPWKMKGGTLRSVRVIQTGK